MASWIWVLIPLAAILMGGLKEWLQFKSKQDRLGTSARALEGEVAALNRALEDSEAQRRAMQRRLENLETIVTSAEWDALPEVADQLSRPDEGEPLEANPSARTAQRAKRLGG